MLQIVIFSYNRAMQLDALLESVKKYLLWQDYEIDVLYNTSDNKYQLGYDILIEKYKNISFYKERPLLYTTYSFAELTNLFNIKLLCLCPHLRRKKTNFRHLLLRVLRKSSTPFTMFMTDDSVFIRPVKFELKDFEWVQEDPSERQLSLRHGEEVIGVKSIKTTDNGYEWSFSDYGNNDHWGYRFSLDAHIYCRVTLSSLLKRASFSNPNTLESSVLLHSCHKGMFSIGRCFRQMGILSYPINIVQTTFSNKALNAKPSVLNDYYIKGYRLVYPVLKDFSSFQIYPVCIYMCKENERITLFVQ